MDSVVTFAHRVLADYVKEDSLCVDFTAGHGNDTLFLAQLCPKGRVYAFDIQKEAIAATESLLEQNQITNAKVILDSHEKFRDYINIPFDAGIFNLGYLPQANKTITTKAESTLDTLEQALPLLKANGAIVLAVYVGHDKGKEEGRAVEAFAQRLDNKFFNTAKLCFLNKKDPPFLLVIEKK